MLCDPEARAMSPQHLDSQDVENYLDHLWELRDLLVIPASTHVMNIQQLFDADWNYLGAWYSCNNGKNTDFFWIWADEEWDTEIFYDSPRAMYKHLHKTKGITRPNYRVFGNCNNWMLLSAGDISYASFVD